MDKNVHKEHRKRVRAEFLADGFSEATSPHKILEMLLFYSIPRADTNPTAHLLIEKFGSFEKVIDAPIEELKKVKGMGENSAVLLKLMVPVIRLYMKEKTGSSKKRRFTLEGLAEFLNARYTGYTKEVFAITTLDNNGSLIGFDIVAEGDVGTVGVQTRVVVENVIKRNATYVILSHNHPGGNATPSAADIKTTENLSKALRAINVYVLDHIILCDDDWVSLAISNEYKHLFK